MELKWISPRLRLPMDGEEVLAVVSGSHGGLRYDHEVVNAIYDNGAWYLDDGVVDDQDGIRVHDWMPMPPAEEPPGEPVRIDGREALNRLQMISASAGQWSGPRVIQEAIGEIRQMMASAAGT